MPAPKRGEHILQCHCFYTLTVTFLRSCPKQVDAKEFLAAGDKDGNGCLDEQELDDDFHSYGELVDGETHAYMLVLDTDQDACVSLTEMEVGVMTGVKQCDILEDISAKSFQDNGCMVREVITLCFEVFLG